MQSNPLHKPAFTLIELLLVIGIIGVLASIVIIAVDPVKQLNDAFGAAGNNQANQLSKAIQQYLIDNGEFPSVLTSTPQTICSPSQTGATCVSLDAALTPTYISEIPQVGTYDSPDSGLEAYIDGSFLVVNSKLDAEETGTTSPLITSGLINHWRFNEGTGTSVTDSVAGNNGTYTNLTSANWSTEEPSTGLYENSYQGGPANGQVTLDSTVSLPVTPASQWTISYWYYQESTNDMSMGEVGTSINRIYHQSYFRIHLDNSNIFDITGFVPNSNLNAWHHFTLMWNGTTFEGYVDGTAYTYSPVSYAGASTAFILDTIGLAFHTTSYTWLGKLSDVRLYDRVLTPTEITQIVNGEG